MFGKITSYVKSLFSKKAPGNIEDLLDRIDVYLPRERVIYQFFDGQVVRAVDPMEIYKKVSPKLAIISADSKAVKVPNSKFAGKAHDNMIAIIREIFAIKPLSEGGLTEMETLAVFDHWWDFARTVKKNSSPSQTDAQATLPSTASAIKEEESPPSSKPLDSGSIAKEDSTKPQPQSDSEPPLHSE